MLFCEHTELRKLKIMNLDESRPPKLLFLSNQPALPALGMVNNKWLQLWSRAQVICAFVDGFLRRSQPSFKRKLTIILVFVGDNRLLLMIVVGCDATGFS